MFAFNVCFYSQDFTGGLSYANLASTSSMSNKTMDVELIETSK